MTNLLKHAVIVSHPSGTSFTHAIAACYAEAVGGHGHQVVMRDLYRLGFDPVLKDHEQQGRPSADVVDEWDALGEVDVFVLVYPIWYGTPPAMLKGYIERVFGAGLMRGLPLEQAAVSKVRGKQLVSLTLSSNMSAWLDERGVLGSLRNLFDRYLAEALGLSATHHYHFDGVQPGLPDRDYAYHLADAKEAAAKVLASVALQSRATPTPIGSDV